MNIDFLWYVYLNIFSDSSSTLVQIGANDGKSHGDEALFSAINANKLWKVILIEPLEENFNRLLQNYSDLKERKNIFFEKVAIGEKDEKKIIYANLDNDEALGAFSTFNDFLAKKYFSNINFSEVEVDVKKFSYIKEKYNIENIDILQIDTEGYDLIILKQIFLNNIYPKLIKVENPSFSPEMSQDIVKLLSTNSYMVFGDSKAQDFIAIKKFFD